MAQRLPGGVGNGVDQPRSPESAASLSQSSMFNTRTIDGRPRVLPLAIPTLDNYRRSRHKSDAKSERLPFSPTKSTNTSAVRNLSPPSNASHMSDSFSMTTLDSSSRRRMDMQSIFSNVELRHGLDPSLCFCDSPGPNLPHQSLVDSLKVDGKHKTPGLHFSASRVPRFPEYRDPYRKPDDPRHQEQELPVVEESFSSLNSSWSKKEKALPSVHANKTKIRRKDIPKQVPGSAGSAEAVFDSSSYPKRHIEYTLAPSYINSQAKANLFRGLMLSRGGKR
jgi:hypothetical protein